MKNLLPLMKYINAVNGRQTVMRMLLCAAFFTLHSSLFTLQAQDSISTSLFGYISYEQTLRQVPAYDEVQQQLADLRSQYAAELQRAEQEFNKKYEEFLDGRADFPTSILRKRQTELQELMDKNVAFREQARRDLQKAEAEALAPLRSTLDKAIAAVALRHGLAFVLNTDQNACPFINPVVGQDVSPLVMEELKQPSTP